MIVVCSSCAKSILNGSGSACRLLAYTRSAIISSIATDNNLGINPAIVHLFAALVVSEKCVEGSAAGIYF